jgi:hypothetical protein
LGASVLARKSPFAALFIDTYHHFGGNEERSPRDDDEKTGGQVVHVKILELMPSESDFKSGNGKVSYLSIRQNPGGRSRKYFVFYN